MSKIEIEGGNPLCGELCVQGSKNSILPILAAGILCEGKTVLHGCPNISDVSDTLDVLTHIGCEVSEEGNTVIIDAFALRSAEVLEETIGNTRSSMMMLGALLGRMNRAMVRYPGGCTIGKRPINLHVMALSKMGASIREQEEGLLCTTEGLHGAEITLPLPSVGVTENVILAAVLAKGKTVLRNAAKEPEVVALCTFLKQAGAKISGAGTSCIRMEGVNKLYGTEFQLPCDRIVAGTYLTAIAATGGEGLIRGVPASELRAVIKALRAAGCKIKEENSCISIQARGRRKSIPMIATSPFPGFPTDMQSQLLAMLTMADGTSVIRETIFENRFCIVTELRKMGASIVQDADKVIITGVKGLTGAQVKAEELRGSAALLIAGVMAEGRTVIRPTCYLTRGYSSIVTDFEKLGARIYTVD